MPRLNAFQLKCIAVLTMIVDHAGEIFFPKIMLLQYIGRISFPIFCFLLVEGFFHTRDIEKYMVRLGICALISEIPYDLAFYGTILEFEHQNVIFTLFIGVIMMYALEKSAEIPIKIVDVLLAMWFVTFLCADYSYLGVLLIAIYYFLRNRKIMKLGVGAAWNLLWNTRVQGYGIFASIPIALYNGEKGLSIKYFFYVFYPVHLLVLYVILLCIK